MTQGVDDLTPVAARPMLAPRHALRRNLHVETLPAFLSDCVFLLCELCSWTRSLGPATKPDFAGERYDTRVDRNQPCESAGCMGFGTWRHFRGHYRWRQALESWHRARRRGTAVSRCARRK